MTTESKKKHIKDTDVGKAYTSFFFSTLDELRYSSKVISNPVEGMSCCQKLQDREHVQ